MDINGGVHSSEKYDSQLGLLFPIRGKIKHVPNHQPGNVMVINIVLYNSKKCDNNNDNNSYNTWTSWNILLICILVSYMQILVIDDI